MMMSCYSFLDTKSGLFSLPFYMQMDGLARRAAIDVATDLSTTPGRHPEDFVLYRLGQFDDNLGQFVSETPVSLGVLAALLVTKG